MATASVNTCDAAADEGTASVTWIGASGQRYVFTAEPLESFVLTDGYLYLLAEGAKVLWVGAARNLVDEQASRARFRDAIARGAAVYRMREPKDDLACMTTIWDLETGRDAA